MLYSLAARIDEHLVRWALQKFKRLRGRPTRAWRWLDTVRPGQPTLFARWYLLPSPPRRAVGAVGREIVPYGSERAGGGSSLPLLARALRLVLLLALPGAQDHRPDPPQQREDHKSDHRRRDARSHAEHHVEDQRTDADDREP